MTDTAAPSISWLDTIKTLTPIVLPLVTFLTGIGTTMLAHHLTRVDKLEEKQQARLEVPLVRLGDIEDVMKPYCGDLSRKLDGITQLVTPAPKIPTKPAKAQQPVRPLL